jgi:hypothetical protein
MSFGIPLSSKNLLSNDSFNQLILRDDYTFIHPNQKYKIPMRAVIHQATRIDGNVLNKKWLLGKITNNKIQEIIENKLLNWIFSLD